ncbi:MAG: type II toxin-antitoxin system VapB family antitoxin [Gallionellaceae bacterium]
MRTNIDIDDKLMQEAMRYGGFSSKKNTVEAALRILVQQHEQRQILKLFGNVAWEGDLDDMRTSKYVQAKPKRKAA